MNTFQILLLFVIILTTITVVVCHNHKGDESQVGKKAENYKNGNLENLKNENCENEGSGNGHDEGSQDPTAHFVPPTICPPGTTHGHLSLSKCAFNCQNYRSLIPCTFVNPILHGCDPLPGFAFISGQSGEAVPIIQCDSILNGKLNVNINSLIMPSFGVRVPSVDIKMPSIEGFSVSAPSVDVKILSTNELSRSAPSTDLKIPSVSVPSMDVETPSMSPIDGPSVNVKNNDISGSLG